MFIFVKIHFYFKNLHNRFGRTEKRPVNSYDNRQNFLFRKQPINQTLLLFGNGVIKPQSSVLSGLRKGGVVKRHSDVKKQDTGTSEEIKISV